jgi:hypothetical protein
VHSQFTGFTGLFSSWFGDGTVATVLADAAGVAALAIAVVLGVAVRRDRSRLGPALIAATTLSLLASPHTLAHDLTLLAPMLVVAVAEAAQRAGSYAWPQRPVRLILAVWLMIVAAAGLDSAVAMPAVLGRLTPLVLALATYIPARAVWPARLSRGAFRGSVATEGRTTYVA